MKKKVLGIAALAVAMHTHSAWAATALEYNVRATLPQGQTVSATVSMSPGRRPEIVSGPHDRTGGAVIEALTNSNLVAQAALSGKHDVQVMIGPQRTCVHLKLSTNGNAVTATGNVEMPPPPPREQDDRQPPQGGPPQGDRRLNVRITETLDHQQLRSARGEISPEDAGGPHFEWTLEKAGR